MNNLIIQTKENNLHDNKVEIQRQIDKEYKLLATVLANKGHTLFEYNKESRQVEPAQFKIEQTVFVDKGKPDINKKKKVIINKNCFYLQSLNKKNAIKRLKKLGFDPLTI